jgi:hypothetical protein
MHQPIAEQTGSSEEFIRPQPIPDHRYHQSNVSFNPADESSIITQNMPNLSQANMNISVEARDKLYRDRIEAMTLDNQSLQRRLNQVSSEMERIQRENEDIYRQINMTQGDVQRMD